MQAKEQIIRKAYAGFNRRDIDAVLALMQPDVDWPYGMEGGRVVGQDAVRAYWTRQWGVLDPNVDPVKITESNDGTVVVDVHQVVRDMSGALLQDVQIEHVYTFAGPLIARMEIRSPPQP